VERIETKLIKSYENQTQLREYK